jgi:hypothetical protein
MTGMLGPYEHASQAADYEFRPQKKEDFERVLAVVPSD